MDSKYASRKFILTMTTVVLTAMLAYFEKMNGDVALVFGAAIAAYNFANYKVHEITDGKLITGES